MALVAYPLLGVLLHRFGRRRILAQSLVSHGVGVLVFYGASGPL